jgi:hypothetical protein
LIFPQLTCPYVGRYLNKRGVEQWISETLFPCIVQPLLVTMKPSNQQAGGSLPNACANFSDELSRSNRQSAFLQPINRFPITLFRSTFSVQPFPLRLQKKRLLACRGGSSPFSGLQLCHG